jgi:catechol 2,3-dioxygenase-like lactoylglutathione lyase family enzyme
MNSAAPRLNAAQPARHPDPTVRAQALAYLMFERPDLDRAHRFLVDFGLSVAQRTPRTLYMRGTGCAPYCHRVDVGPKPRFVGFGLLVPEVADLEKLAALHPGARVEDCPHPGGGRLLRLKDPSGFVVEAVAGQERVKPQPHRAPLPLNFPGARARVNATQRPPMQPPEILRIGHLVLEVADFQATCGWYTRHFGFIPSDVQVLPDGSPGVSFMRLDLGGLPADHHTLALVQGFMPAYNHSAYEVVDADAVGVGQRVLRDRGYRHAWGIGRHILGSQIFDYWQDPWGDKHEHYCDGDLFTAELATGIHAVSREAMAQWGPAMPASFTKPRLTLPHIAALIRNLRRSPDLSLGKLLTLARLFG